MIIEKEKLERIKKLTSTEYGEIRFKEDLYFIFPEYLERLVDDLLCEISYLEEKIEDLENKEKQESEYDPHDLYLDHKEGII